MTATPPVLFAQGRKARARKEPAIRPKEIALHMSVAKVLREHCRSEWRWTHIPAGEIRDIRTAVKLKRMRTKPGWPDFVLIPSTAQLHCLELKRQGETLSDDQEAFQTWCISHGVPHAVAFTIDQALAVLDTWGARASVLGASDEQPLQPRRSGLFSSWRPSRPTRVAA